MHDIFVKVIKLFKIKYTLSLPEKKNLLVFDLESYEDFKYLLKNMSHYCLNVRFLNENKIYIHPKIFWKIIKNYRGNLWSAYLISIIECVSPKKIITNIDNSFKFSEICRRLCNKINFYAIQNGARYDLKIFKKNYQLGKTKSNFCKDLFFDNFLCFGDFEIDDYKKNKIKVKKFYPIGSLRLANYLKNKNYIGEYKKNIYDINLISDGFIKNFDEKFHTYGDAEKQAKAISYLIKFSRENEKKFICSFKRLNSTNHNLKLELDYYKYYLNENDYSYLISNSTLNFKKHKYLSYEIMQKSEIVFSAYSTMLRERLSMKKKAVSINFMSNDIFDFPLNGICKLNFCNYENFKKHLTKCFALKNEDFLKKISPNPDYLMKYQTKTSSIDLIKSIIILP